MYDGMLYAQSGSAMDVFDANGMMDCSGTPKTCSPLWSTTDVGLSDEVTISSNNLAYVVGAAGTTIYVFDALGKSGCTGTPVVCSPLWTYTTEVPAAIPVVSGSTLYVDTGLPIPSTSGGLEAFDANGSSNCSGTPTVCTPLWRSSSEYASLQPPAVANGEVYVPSGQIAAFSANGSTNCSGLPTICTPLWTSSAVGGWSPLTVGGSVLYAVSRGHNLYAFDATGVSGCSKAVCNPLWSENSLIPQGVSIANDGTVYVTSVNSVQVGNVLVQRGYVDAFALP